MWPLHKLTAEARDAARYCAEKDQELLHEEIIGMFQAEKMSKKENEKVLIDALQGGFHPPTALEKEISAHPIMFKLAVVLHRVRRRAWRRVRNWTIAILAAVGFITLFKIIQNALEPIIGEGPLYLMYVAIVLGAFCIIDKVNEEEKRNEIELEKRTAELTGQKGDFSP